MKYSTGSAMYASPLGTYRRHRLKCLQSEVIAEACRSGSALSGFRQDSPDMRFSANENNGNNPGR